ncbi:MAG: allantoicase [Pseudomonadota bacterium]|nr:allantoicase [Pseudomonadota bacterium]
MSDPSLIIRSEETKPDFATEAGAVNLASPRLGAKVTDVSDEFFAPRTRMLEDTSPVFYPDRYDEHGKWMDGWETRRRRGGGNDHCILQLGTKGIIAGLNLNTRFFTGNHPPRARVEAALTYGAPDRNTQWVELLPESDLDPDSPNAFKINDDSPYNYIRLNIYPDGGIARFRVWGNPVPEWDRPDPDGHHELSAIVNGGRVVGYNDAHYGDPWVILTSGRGQNMGDGWETRRRRTPGNDWIVIALGAAGIAKKIEVDTAHFKGNYPERCSILAANLPPATSDADILDACRDWETMIPEQNLQMDHIHIFDSTVIDGSVAPITHIRLNIFPDGGVSRIRVFGPVVEAG